MVTGATGFVGGFLTRRLLARGAVLGVARTPPPPASGLSQLAADISAPLPDAPTFRGATIVHTAAVMKGAEHEPYWKTNVEGTYRVCEWAIRHEAQHLILFSTGGVYPYARGHHWREDQAPDPIEFYGQTKLLAEGVAQAYHRLHGLPVTVLRLFFPYGEGQKKGVLKLIEDGVRCGNPLTVHAGGAPVLNPVHLDDVADAVLRLLPAAGWRLFNLCGDEDVSFLDLVRLQEDRLGRKAVLQSSGKEHGDLLGANEALKDAVKWRPVRRLAA